MAAKSYADYTLNHDDRALYRYLQQDRSGRGRLLMLGVIKSRITTIVSQPWQELSVNVVRSLAQFIVAVEENTFGAAASIPPWYAFLSFYRLNQGSLRFADKLWEYHYFARDVLINALHEDPKQLTGPLMQAFEPAAATFVSHNFPNSAVSFADVYQEAFLNLLQKPPAVDYPHTAQLFTYFRQILFRRCADVIRGTAPKNTTDADKNPEEGNNPESFTDHIIENYDLAQRFGTDDAAEIVREGMEKLGDQCRRLLRLRFFRNMRFREISDLTGHSTDSIGTRIKRCLKKLREGIFGNK
ncbi:hypothetical protein CEQ90_05670 [Lewinellaceae bacterium SD302]|nr:hypothetical protein CEQ90_05670 [Lewinellaceae bacterium SD302]